MTTETSARPAGLGAAPASRSPVAVDLENVSKVYTRRRLLGLRPGSGAARHALRNVSFKVLQGEMVGLLGPNGAGKTTLMKSVATLLKTSSGRITVYGKNVDSDPLGARRLMGLVTCDERSFYWRLTGRQNLNFFAALYGVPEKIARDRIDLLFDKLGLTSSADVPYQNYSTGMRQKMAIARGLLGDPRLVLYDEPTRSLDPLSAQTIRDWIVDNRIASPATTHLIATNQLGEAEQLCDRVLILNHGAVIADGSIGQIRDRFASRGTLVHRITCTGFSPRDIEPYPEIGLFEVRLDFTGTGATLMRVTTSETGEGLTFVLSEILGRGGSVSRCETEQMSFDEVFCSLVTGDASASGSRK